MLLAAILSKPSLLYRGYRCYSLGKTGELDVLEAGSILANFVLIVCQGGEFLNIRKVLPSFD